MENGGGTPKNASHGVSPWNFLELGFWASSGFPLSAATASSSCLLPSALSGVDAIGCSRSSPVTTSCLPFSDRRLLVTDGSRGGDHVFYRGPPSSPQQQQQQQQQVTCLKLGKRQYYVAEGSNGVMPAKRPVELASAVVGGSAAPMPRCQVDGCNKALVNEKEYHKRHKVCEVHSKVPKVVLFGTEQRFCQQCSRFHVISEFDDTKRSCRRRLAGHNERRRKSSNDSNIRNIPSFENAMTECRVPLLSTSPGRALSLLSSKESPWVSTSDLSSRSSAALRELIAENRAAVLERQLITTNRGCWNNNHNNVCLGSGSSCPQEHQLISHSLMPQQGYNGWNHFHEAAAGSSLTLDLMQQLPSSFEFLSKRSKSKEEEECCEILNSMAGAHVI